AVATPPDAVRFTLGTTADGSPVLHALLLAPTAGAVTLDAQVTAAIRAIAQEQGDGADGLVLTPEPRHGEVSVVTIPLREMPARACARCRSAQPSRRRRPVHSDSDAPTKPSTTTRRWRPLSRSRF